MKIEKVTLEQVQAQKFKPEAHTVAFKESEGQYYALTEGNSILSVLRVRVKGKTLYIGEVYTAPQYRRMGLCFTLVKFVSDVAYKGYRITAHCLQASKHIFERCGFIQYNQRNFPHGTQYWMMREGEDYGTPQKRD